MKGPRGKCIGISRSKRNNCNHFKMTSSKYITKVHEPWTEIVTKKRAIRDAQIDKHWKAHTNSTFDRISSETVDVEVLTSLLRDGKVSAVKVIHAYIRREVEVTVTKFFMLTVTLEPVKRRNRYPLPVTLPRVCLTSTDQLPDRNML